MARQRRLNRDRMQEFVQSPKIRNVAATHSLQWSSSLAFRYKDHRESKKFIVCSMSRGPNKNGQRVCGILKTS
jgi:hypothetical protein